MSPEKRLDQLEPVIGEMAAQLDLHTAQLRRVTTGITTIMEIVSRQSDDIIFLLKGQAQMKTDITGMKTDITGMKTDITGMKTDITGMKTEITGMKTDITGMKTDITGMKTGITGMKTDITQINNKLDGVEQMVTAILNAVQKPTGN